MGVRQVIGAGTFGTVQQQLERGAMPSIMPFEPVLAAAAARMMFPTVPPPPPPPTMMVPASVSINIPIFMGIPIEELMVP
jgi:hypothetical protein